MTPHEHFAALGKITECKNKAHHFRLLSMMGYWQWANDPPWVGLDSNDRLVSHWLFAGKVETLDGLTGYKFVFGPLILMFGFV